MYHEDMITLTIEKPHLNTLVNLLLDRIEIEEIVRSCHNKEVAELDEQINATKDLNRQLREELRDKDRQLNGMDAESNRTDPREEVLIDE